MSALNDQFYARLPINQVPLGEVLTTPELFFPVPPDWHVIITDIIGSTNAVLSGKHQQVNLIATGSTVSVLNIAFNKKINIPFFFGGDGSTFIVPPTLVDPVIEVLSQYRASTLANFNLTLRIGKVSVEQIYNQGCKLLIAKFSSSASFAIPVLLGDGLQYAEGQIKGADYLLALPQTGQKEPDLTGMLCRWDRIPAPDGQQEVVTLLIVAQANANQAVAFSKIMNEIDHIYGPPQKRQPITEAKLKLKSTFTRLNAEVRSGSGRTKWYEPALNWYINMLGYIYFHTQTGKAYLKSLVEMSDTLLIDGKINTIISGTSRQRHRLQTFLEGLMASGDIIYGMHVSNSSVMSCYVRNPEDGHIYFVDGSDGGYTMAAQMLKSRINKGQ